MSRFFLLIFAVFWIPPFLFANEQIREAKTLGKDIGASLSDKVEQFVRSEISVNKGENDTGTGGIINFRGLGVPETQFTDGGMSSAAQSKIKENTVSETIQDTFLRQKDFRMKGTDSFLDKARHAQKNPEKYIDWLDGGYSGCEEKEGENILAKETKVCDEYHQISENQWSIGRKIEVDANHKYECSLKRLLSNRTCKSKLQVSIEKKLGCEVDDEIRKSIKYGTYNSSIIIISDPGSQYTPPLNRFEASFKIKDKNQIKRLTLARAHFNCVVRVLVNNQQVYLGPDGGDQLSFRHVEYGGDRTYYRWEVYTGIRTYTLHTSYCNEYDKNHLNIDLIPYLINGENTVTIETGGRESFNTFIEISAVNNCVTEKEVWEEICQD